MPLRFTCGRDSTNTPTSSGVTFEQYVAPIGLVTPDTAQAPARRSALDRRQMRIVSLGRATSEVCRVAPRIGGS